MANNNKHTPAVNSTAGVTEESRFAEQKAESDKVAADKAITDKAEADKVAADKVIADKAEADKVAADKAKSDKSIEATIIPSGRFIAENGNEFEFAVSSFTFKGKTYTKEEALSDHADVLEHLISVKSFILKKV